MKNKEQTLQHVYLLPDGTKVANQLEGRTKLGIGRNAFRNRVKSGIIKKLVSNDKPQGFNENTINSTIRKN